MCAHLILGLPGETRDDVLATARAVATMPLDAVKIHNLYVVAGTPLEQMYRHGEAGVLQLDEYVSLVADVLELLPPAMVIERILRHLRLPHTPPRHAIDPHASNAPYSGRGPQCGMKRVTRLRA